MDMIKGISMQKLIFVGLWILLMLSSKPVYQAFWPALICCILGLFIDLIVYRSHDKNAEIIKLFFYIKHPKIFSKFWILLGVSLAAGNVVSFILCFIVFMFLTRSNINPASDYQLTDRSKGSKVSPFFPQTIPFKFSQKWVYNTAKTQELRQLGFLSVGIIFTFIFIYLKIYYLEYPMYATLLIFTLGLIYLSYLIFTKIFYRGMKL